MCCTLLGAWHYRKWLCSMYQPFQQHLHITGMGSLFASWCTSCLYKHPRNWLCLYGYPMEVFGGPLVLVPNSSPHLSALLCLCLSVYLCVLWLPVCLECSPMLHAGFTGCEHRSTPDGTMPSTPLPSPTPAVPTPTSAINIPLSDRERWYLFMVGLAHRTWCPPHKDVTEPTGRP